LQRMRAKVDLISIKEQAHGTPRTSDMDIGVPQPRLLNEVSGILNK
jgi:hypothetical protein